jgi:hypothetical protein
MKIRKLFAKIAAGLVRRSSKVEPADRQDEPTPPAEEETRSIAAGMNVSKWTDVEYYGPGAQAANERRAKTLAALAGKDNEAPPCGVVNHDVRPD